MLTWGDLISFRERLQAAKRPIEGRLQDLEERASKRTLNEDEREELRFLKTVAAPPLRRMTETWNALVDRAAEPE